MRGGRSGGLAFVESILSLGEGVSAELNQKVETVTPSILVSDLEMQLKVIETLGGTIVESGLHYFTIWMEGTIVSGVPIINAHREAEEVRFFPW